METLFSPELALVVRDVGIFGIAHLAILANRALVRPAINNGVYDQMSLYSEHFVSYLTTCLLGRAMNHVLGSSFDDIAVPLFRAVGGDLIIPIFNTDRRKPQWDQFAVDVLGIGAYVSMVRRK